MFLIMLEKVFLYSYGMLGCHINACPCRTIILADLSDCCEKLIEHVSQCCSSIIKLQVKLAG